jgi:glycosyltransferase 2 family protein
LKRALKYFLGFAVSLVFLYFSVRGLNVDKLLVALKDTDYFYLVPAIFFFLSVHGLRSIRWGIILSPITQIKQKKLFPIFCVGFMAVVLVPMRAGELVRPYLLSTAKIASFSSSCATIFVERTFDIMSLLGIFLVVCLNASPPPWVVKSGYFAFSGFIVMIMFICFLYFKTECAIEFIRFFIKYFPDRFRSRIIETAENFVKGFEIISNPAGFFAVLLLSMLIWILSGLTIYCLFLFHGFKLSMLAAFVVLVITIMGISLPTAPGMLGNFQFSCIVALSLFNIEKDPAFLFSMVYYFLGIGITILVGIMFMPVVNFSFRDVFKDMKK